ncbi:MAG TPA: antibiotic biosynthesis monooxygenase [Myxococcaceae bacterium]|nr:antibiotic biosynthesis monooxygenase [Myxococcaceae bacterium]
MSTAPALAPAAPVPAADDGQHGPLTMVIARRIKRGMEAAYEDWVRGVLAVAETFAGHQGATLLRPGAPEDREYVLVVRWATFEDLRRWNESPERNDWVRRAEPLAEELKVTTQTGLETWFTIPGRPPPAPPSRAKMAVLSWVAIYPLIVALNATLGPYLGPLPMPLRALVTSLMLVPLMTWVVMPRVTKLFYRWLYPQRR